MRVVAGMALLLAGLLVVVSVSARTVRSADRFENWLNAVAGTEEDRGWSYLSPESREQAYGGDLAAYVGEAHAADWSAFEWGKPHVRWTDDGFAHVEARLASPPSSVPRFLLDRRLIHGICIDGLPVAVGVYDNRRLFTGGLSGGGLSGSGAACNRLFNHPPS